MLIWWNTLKEIWISREEILSKNCSKNLIQITKVLLI